MNNEQTAIRRGYIDKRGYRRISFNELLADNKRLKKTLDAAMRSRDRIIDEWTPPNRAAIAKVEGGTQ